MTRDDPYRMQVRSPLLDMVRLSDLMAKVSGDLHTLQLPFKALGAGLQLRGPNQMELREEVIQLLVVEEDLGIRNNPNKCPSAMPLPSSNRFQLGHVAPEAVKARRVLCVCISPMAPAHHIPQLTAVM